MTHRPNTPTWYSFGHIQRVIRDRYREEKRSGSLPTFKEFIKYLVRISVGELSSLVLYKVGELSPSTTSMKKMTRMINEHWKPVWLNCAPCSEK